MNQSVGLQSDICQPLQVLSCWTIWSPMRLDVLSTKFGDLASQSNTAPFLPEQIKDKFKSKNDGATSDPSRFSHLENTSASCILYTTFIYSNHTYTYYIYDIYEQYNHYTI